MSDPSPISVQIAGSGAVRAHPQRGGPCFVVEIGDKTLVFDCGRCAVHNLSRFGIPVESVSEVFITHLHFDHICDLPLLLLLSWNNGRDRHLPVYGPTGLGDFLEFGLRKAYGADIQSRVAHGKNPDFLEWELTELSEEGVVCDTNDYTIDTLITAHAGLLNFNFRLKTPEKKILILSDSEPDPRLVEFCRDADLVLFECSGTRAFYDTVPWGKWHIPPEEIGRIMRDANAKTVILKHLVIESFTDDPGISESMAETIREIYPAGEIIVGQDGMRIEV